MANIKAGLRYFWNDLTDVTLFKTKFCWFSLLFGIVIIWPFFGLHMVSLGITERDVGVISAISAAMFIVQPPLTGFIADKIGNYKYYVSGLTFLAGLASLLFTIVPSAASSSSGPENAYDIGIRNVTCNTTNTSINTLQYHNNTDNNITYLQHHNDYLLTFWYYAAVRITFVFCQGAAFTLFDGVMMTQLKAMGVDYGMQYAWGALATGIAALAGAYFNDNYGFSMLFYISGVFHMAAAATLLFHDMPFKRSAKYLSKEIWTQIMNPEMLMLIFVLMAVGACTGYIETYLYIYLSKLGASNILIGLTISVGVPPEIMMQLCSTAIVTKIGHVNVMLIGLLSIAVRLLGLSFLTEPWWVLPFEVLESLSYGLIITTSVMYCASLVTMSSIASFRGIIGVAYWGIGRLLGTSFGTIIREYLDDRGAFMVMSGFALVTFILYFIAFYLYKKNRTNKYKLQMQQDDEVQIPTSEEKLQEGFENCNN